MSVVKNSTDMRKDAAWMSRGADDRILELLREHGNLTPSAAASLSDERLSTSHAQNRMPELAKYGLAGRIAPGLYFISRLGLGYLDEVVDASELPAREPEDILGPDDAPEFVYVYDNDQIPNE